MPVILRWHWPSHVWIPVVVPKLHAKTQKSVFLCDVYVWHDNSLGWLLAELADKVFRHLEVEKELKQLLHELQVGVGIDISKDYDESLKPGNEFPSMKHWYFWISHGRKLFGLTDDKLNEQKAKSAADIMLRNACLKCSAQHCMQQSCSWWFTVPTVLHPRLAKELYFDGLNTSCASCELCHTWTLPLHGLYWKSHPAGDTVATSSTCVRRPCTCWAGSWKRGRSHRLYPWIEQWSSP